MLPDRVLNPGLLTYKSGALLIALQNPATVTIKGQQHMLVFTDKTKVPSPEVQLQGGEPTS